MPASSRSPSRFTRCALLVKPKAARPYGRRFASAMTASKSRNGFRMAMGPKGSSFMMRAEFGTSASTVGSKKNPLRAMRLPPASSRAPCVQRLVDEALHRRQAARVRQRAHAIGLVDAVAHRQGPGARGETFREPLVDGLLHVEARRRHAHLARVAILRRRRRHRAPCRRRRRRTPAPARDRRAPWSCASCHRPRAWSAACRPGSIP